jgi:hypothetical protein
MREPAADRVAYTRSELASLRDRLSSTSGNDQASLLAITDRLEAHKRGEPAEPLTSRDCDILATFARSLRKAAKGGPEKDSSWTLADAVDRIVTAWRRASTQGLEK